MPARSCSAASAATPVAVLAGRAHYYEHGRSDVMRPALETLKALGVDTLILTNAAGSLRQDIPPGSVMLITDHINFGNRNPLIGETTRCPLRRHDARPTIAELRRGRAGGRRSTRAWSCTQGVYMWFSGPSFETPAEIRAARMLGADARRHVDGAGGDPRALPGAAGARLLGRHQLRRRA